MGSQSRTDVDWRKAKAAAKAATKAASVSASASIPISVSAKAVDPPPPAFYKSFASFIFVCNNNTIPDLDRRIFGLPAKYIDSVRAIRKGMPLFLYNYSTRFLHGLFEATSDGGYNLDPHAWENTDATSNGRPPMSRYPAQVRVRVVDKMLMPLQLDRFNPVLDHEEDGKFKLELTHHQVQRLLRLFDASNANNWIRDGSTFVATPSGQPTSPNFICPNDSDSCSVSSSGGTNTQDEEEEDEEDWRKGFYPPNGYVLGERLQEEELLSLSERATKLALKEEHGPSNSTRVSVEANGMKRRDNQRGAGGGGGGGGGRSGLLSSSSENSENSMLSRLRDLADPAVNSGRLFSLAHSQLHVGGGEEHTLPVPVPVVASTSPHSHRGVSKWTTTTSTSSTTPPKPSASGTWSRWNPRKHAPLANQDTKAKHIVPEKDDEVNNSTPPLNEVGGTPSTLPIPPPLSLPPPPSSEWGLQVPVLLMHPIVKDARENIPLNAALHREILQFAKLARPSHLVRLQAEAAIHCIRSVVKWVWPEADVEVFGSFATGLCLRHSDVDLAVVGAPLPHTMEVLSVGQASSCLIRELASTLEVSKWCESINVLDTASMPVLKCHCRPTTLHSESLSLPSIAVDITIGAMRKAVVEAGVAESTSATSGSAAKIIELSSKHTGGLAREYVLQKIRELPALAPLALLLKSYLHHRGLSNVYYGGLGSFSLTLLLAFFLERVPVHFEASSNGKWAESSALSPASCSPLASSEDSNFGGSSSSSCDVNLDASGDHFLRRASSVMDRVLKLWETRGAPCLGILLMGFLQTFGFQVDLATVKIVLKSLDGNPSGIFERDHDERHIALWIDDPLRPGVNVGAGSFGMFHVQAAFRDMLEVFKNPHLSISPSPNSKSICSDIPNDWYYLNRIFVDSENYCSQSSPL